MLEFLILKIRCFLELIGLLAQPLRLAFAFLQSPLGGAQKDLRVKKSFVRGGKIVRGDIKLRDFTLGVAGKTVAVKLKLQIALAQGALAALRRPADHGINPLNRYPQLMEILRLRRRNRRISI